MIGIVYSPAPNQPLGSAPWAVRSVHNALPFLWEKRSLRAADLWEAQIGGRGAPRGDQPHRGRGPPTSSTCCGGRCTPPNPSPPRSGLGRDPAPAAPPQQPARAGPNPLGTQWEGRSAPRPNANHPATAAHPRRPRRQFSPPSRPIGRSYNPNPLGHPVGGALCAATQRQRPRRNSPPAQAPPPIQPPDRDLSVAPTTPNPRPRRSGLGRDPAAPPSRSCSGERHPYWARCGRPCGTRTAQASSGTG
jgi:hypothetical protein